MLAVGVEDTGTTPFIPHSHRFLPPSKVVGSVFSLDDPTQPWLTFSAWKFAYAGHNIGANLIVTHGSPANVIYARLLNKPVVVINSEEIAKDFFDLRSDVFWQTSLLFLNCESNLGAFSFGADYLTPLLRYGDR